jgi:hypothetical protein
MASATWRGTVGVVKPTYESGSLVEFIRLLPEGVGVIPVYAGIKQHTEQGYLDAMETYHERVAELAKIGVDLMHPEGGPPFMCVATRASGRSYTPKLMRCYTEENGNAMLFCPSKAGRMILGADNFEFSAAQPK